jgi:hypothetical protein
LSVVPAGELPGVGYRPSAKIDKGRELSRRRAAIISPSQSRGKAVSERDNSTEAGTGAARNFYGQCVRAAWGASWDVTNAWPPVAALLVLYGAARVAGLSIAPPAGLDDRVGIPAMAAAFIVTAWIAVFLVQLVAAAPRVAAGMAATAAAAARPPRRPRAAAAAPAAVPVRERATEAPASSVLSVRLHDQIEEARTVDTEGEVLPTARAYVARVTNRSDNLIRRCQLFFGAPTQMVVVSGPFDLEPGAHRDLPVLRVLDEASEPHALAYFLDSETWDVAGGQAAWVPDPGRFKVTALSANTLPASLEVDLACTTAEPHAWTLVEASDLDEARRLGKGSLKQVGFSPVAEPSPGD